MLGFLKPLDTLYDRLLACVLQALLACCCMLATLLPVLEARHTDLSMRMVARAPCQDRNKRLATFIDAVKDEVGFAMNTITICKVEATSRQPFFSDIMIYAHHKPSANKDVCCDLRTFSWLS